MTRLSPDQLDRLIDAPDGFKRLRELVLSLAVRGLLVPQDPRDEPAAGLLERIADSRARLVAGGEVRNRKPSPEVKTENQPFSTPRHWCWIRFNNLFRFIDYRGKTPKKVDSGVPLITAKNVRRGAISRKPREYLTRETYLNWMTRGFPKRDDLLITVEAPLGNIAIVDIEEDFALAQRVICLQPFERKSTQTKFFMFGVMSSLLQNLLLQDASGMTATGIKASRLKEIPLPLPLPPLAEQKRIVAKVEEVMGVIDRLEAAAGGRETARTALRDTLLGALANSPDAASTAHAWSALAPHLDRLLTTPADVDRLHQTILQLAVKGRLVPQDPNDEPAGELFEKITEQRSQLVRKRKSARAGINETADDDEWTVSTPKHWVQCILSDLLIFGPRNGSSPKPVDLQTQTKTLTLSAITRGIFDGSAFKYLADSPPHDSHLWLKRGDILIQRANSLEHVGVSAVYTGDDNEFVYPDLIMRCRLADGVLSEFAHLMLSSLPVRNYFRNRASGTSGSMPKINQAVVSATPLSLPPLAEQARIVAKVDELNALCHRLRERFIAREETTKSLAEALATQASTIEASARPAHIEAPTRNEPRQMDLLA